MHAIMPLYLMCQSANGSEDSRFVCKRKQKWCHNDDRDKENEQSQAT